MAWVDSCCLQLTIRGREEPLTFRASEPGARLAWATELRLAQLAQASANSPAWRLPSPHAPAHKMPLFVAATPVYESTQLTEVPTHYSLLSYLPTTNEPLRSNVLNC